MERILKASYGDKDQHEHNLRAPNWNQAAKIQADVKARKAAMGPRELPTPQPGNPHGAVFWNPKLHGTPYGGHRNAPAPARKPVKVEIRPGVYHIVDVAQPNFQQLQQQQQQQLQQQQDLRQGPSGARPRPGSAPHMRPPPPSRGRVQSAAPHRPPRAPYEVDTAELAPAVAKIEESMRQALRQQAAMHVVERTVLLRAVGRVLGKKDVHISMQDTVTTAQFQAIWSSLGLQISQGYVDAIFNKYGQDARGRMPILNFVEALLYGGNRQIMLEHDYVQRGAYQAGKPATHIGKILYPQCKKGVWPPSDWNPQLAERSAQLPDSRLMLEFVYGYDGFQGTSPNIFYLSTGEVVYYAAGVAIVYNKATHKQRFFLGHDDDILCCALHPDKTTVVTGQVGKDPCVIVWDSITCKTITKIHQGYGNRGVQAVTFSSSGSKLACVCTDNSHTLYIWDWQRKQCLMERKTQPGAPPTTYGVVWSPFEPDRVLTYGQNYIKFFLLQRPPPKKEHMTTWSAKQDAGVFSISRTHTIFSACFLPSGIVLTGNADGAIGSWRNCRLSRLTPAHNPGPMRRRKDGTESYGGIRCLTLRQDRTTLLSGGSDGYVITWDVSKGDLGAPLQRIPLVKPEEMGDLKVPSIRGLDCQPSSEVFVAGTSSCDLWEVDCKSGATGILVHGHESNLYGLTVNPAFPHIFATAGESQMVVVWSSATRKPVRIVHVAQKGDKARSCAFSSDGQHLAIGLLSGGIKVVEFYPSVAQVYWGKLNTDSICVLRYSPCGRYLASGSHDQHIDIYDVKAGYKRIARCVGHSSTITGIDWAVDSSKIMSNDQAYEILYFDPLTGKQIKENQRDTEWATWSCELGFPVMGIWPPYSDGSDINSVDRSPSGRYLLTADDQGMVSLLNYPSVVQHAPALCYPGHSSHVTGVRWARDESYAISVGGRDRCIFQWRLAPDVKPPNAVYDRIPGSQIDSQGVAYRA